MSGHRLTIYLPDTTYQVLQKGMTSYGMKASKLIRTLIEAMEPRQSNAGTSVLEDDYSEVSEVEGIFDRVLEDIHRAKESLGNE